MASLFDNVYEDCDCEKIVEPSSDTFVYTDTRTGLKFTLARKVSPIEIYTNYLTFINRLLVDNTLGAKSYFDWGMVPIWAPPSFLMEDIVSMSFVNASTQQNLPVYSLPARTLRGDGVWPKQKNGLGVPKEIWAFREDVIKTFGAGRNLISIIKEVCNANET